MKQNKLKDPSRPPTPGVYGVVKWIPPKWEYGLNADGWALYLKIAGQVQSMSGVFGSWFPSTLSLFRRFGRADELDTLVEDGLRRAIATWDPDKACLQKYWRMWSYNFARRTITEQYELAAKGRHVFSTGLVVGEDETLVDSLAAPVSNEYDLDEAVELVTRNDRTKEIFRLRFDDGHTLQQIGDRFQKSREWVRKIIETAGPDVAAAIGWETPQ